MNLLKQFKEHYHKNLSIYFPFNSKFIIAVSGGVDSVVLVDLFSKLKLDFAIAHCNFKLRNEESERDENFVKDLAVKYSKEIIVKEFDTKKYAEDNKVSIQVAARNLRYEWFQELQTLTFKLQNNDTQIPNCYLVTAHHANDNIETVLMNFFRGSGIQGLTGIATFDKARKIVRPLLPFKKEDLLEYATLNNLRCVEDSSNASNKYTRNNFRNQIIPLVKEHFAAAEENLLSNIHRFSEVEIIYNDTINRLKKSLIVFKGEEQHISILKLKKTPTLYSIVWEIIKDFSFTSLQINEVIKLLDANNGSYMQSASHRIINNRGWLIVTALKEGISTIFVIEKGDRRTEFGNGKILIQELGIKNWEKKQNLENETGNTQYLIPNSIKTALLDLNKVEFPLVLRKWKQGDYFYPLGMIKKQKLSKFFINQKLSLTQKENVWVIESNKKIIWVVGHRIDNRFKITDSTTEIIKLTYLV
ncbi:MAG: tRNA lysidine(34) synthetase TilS [Chitinophagaceae bacterium]